MEMAKYRTEAWESVASNFGMRKTFTEKGILKWQLMEKDLPAGEGGGARTLISDKGVKKKTFIDNDGNYNVFDDTVDLKDSPVLEGDSVAYTQTEGGGAQRYLVPTKESLDLMHDMGHVLEACSRRL